MDDQEVITLSSDDEDSGAVVPVINKVVSLPAADSARHIATALSRAPKNLVKGMKKDKNKQSEETGRDPNRLFSVRVKGDTTDEDSQDDIQDVQVVTRKQPAVEVFIVDDDDEDETENQGTAIADVGIKKPSSSATSNGSEGENASAVSLRTESTEIMDMDDQRSELSIASSSATATLTDYTQASKRALNRFCKLLKSRLIAKDCKQISTLLVNKYAKYVQNQPKEFHEKFAQKLASGIRKIQDGENEWARITKVKAYMKPKEERFKKLMEMEAYETSDDETAQADRENEKKKRIEKLEKELAKIHEKIQQMDEEEVDLNDEDDEHNSAYILRDKLIEKSMKVYYRLCEVTKSLTKTGRPTQKKIVVESITNYPELEKAVQDFMNKCNHLYSPDFTDIYNVVAAENSKIHLPSEMLHKVAEDLHKQVVLTIQERRKLDTLLAFPSSIDLAARDPAEDDSELARKLEENKTKGRTVDSVVDEFVQRAAKEQIEAENKENYEDEESSVDSEDENEIDNNNVQTSEDVPLSEEYATGPEAECLGDDEEDEDVEDSQQVARENTVLSNPVNTDESKENNVEEETDAGEPEAKKIKLA